LLGGYWGKILFVDLSSEETMIATFNEHFARKYVGGVGFAARIIHESVTKSTNPLGPGNVLVFAVGPYQATSLAGTGRCAAAAKSPLTGIWGESNGGGKIGPQLKRAGFDAVAITGRAKRPVYLWICDGEAEIRDAREYWGLDTVETTKRLIEVAGDKRTGVSCIGKGGENLVRYACIANDYHGFFGRTGLGAVMGSKNLKALVVRGTLAPPIADLDKVQDVYKQALIRVKKDPLTQQYREHGQAGDMEGAEVLGSLPMKNWKQDTWTEGVAKIGPPRFTEELQAKPWSCPYCTIGCHRRITNPAYKCETGGPEYETLAMIGANLLIEDLSAIVIANDLCNRYGIDTVELGGILGWAFECYEKGLINKEDTDGVELEWGNGEALVEMTKKVAERRGIGSLLAEGLRACVERIPESKPYAVEVAGQSVPGHDPRAFFGQTITTIASTRGSCHLHGFVEPMEMGVVVPELGITEVIDRSDPTKKGYIGAVYMDLGQFWNSLTMCLFYFLCGFSLKEQVGVLNAITGWDVTPQEAQKIGERVVCLQQNFNLAMGLVPKKDNAMPDRLVVPHSDGGAAGQVPPWKAILDEYWNTKGWTNGIPTQDKLAELGLESLERKKAAVFGHRRYDD